MKAKAERLHELFRILRLNRFYRAGNHVMHEGKVSDIYNVGSVYGLLNNTLTRSILALLGKPESLIQYVADRPGHDRRYSVDCGKLRALGWAPRHPFEAALEETVRWYESHRWWWEPLKSGAHAEWYRKNYGNRQPVASGEAK